jgi:hypothetical protein
VFLGIIGALMFVESLRAIRRSRATAGAAPKRASTGLDPRAALQDEVPDLGALYLGDPAAAGRVLVGILAAIMGVGGGFIMVPAMIYLLGMPTKVVVGTSLFQIIFVTGFATLMHATTNYTVDMVLAVLLLVGGVVGAQIGTRLGTYLKAEQLRILLAIMVLAVCGKLALRPARDAVRALHARYAGGGALIRVALVLLAWATLTVQAVAEDSRGRAQPRRVSITTNFEGSEILIFGAVSRTAPPPAGSELHVIVTVEGPQRCR